MEYPANTRKNFYNKKNQMVGWWVEGVYRKTVNSQKHRLIVMNAYGIDKEIIDELKTLQTKEIRIMETDTNTIYFINFEQFCKLGVERNLQGLQIFLPIHYFQSKICK